ncbi:LanC-like protein, eukaryotic, partial [Cynara cardunculus var. scolymus]
VEQQKEKNGVLCSHRLILSKIVISTSKKLSIFQIHHNPQMADRFFPNELPEFIKEDDPPPPETTTNTLLKTLSLPHNTFSDKLKRTAFVLKETIVTETWGNIGKRLKDYTLYTGALGTAFLVFKAYQVSHNKKDLKLCKDILKACDSASHGSSCMTFMCGQAGVYALGAVVAKQANDDYLCDHYLTRFREIKLPVDLPDELLYGRAGYLWACLFLNKNLGENTISSTQMRTVVDEIIKNGRNLCTGESPLMYEWHGKRYWGAAHGLAGIMNVLMDMILTEDELEDVKGTLLYMIKNRYSSGNYPSSEGSQSDCLVFGGEEFHKAALDAGEVVWERGLLKRVGICHGISGNTYVFLSLYRLTGDVKFLYRAKAFAGFLHDKGQTLISEGAIHGGDHHFSLFEGIGGMAYLFLDMVDPSEARFPAYEL